jgi:hypothetical protein
MTIVDIFRYLHLLTKRIMKRPLTRADIYSYCAELIKTPPMLEGGKHFFREHRQIRWHLNYAS